VTLRALVVDDEAVARRRVRRLLEQQVDVVIVGECGDGATAVESIQTLTPDIVFLDVQMPEFDGFEVVQAVGAEAMPATVFVTAYDAYALRAFDVHALDYLLKPVDADHIARALARARQRLAARDTAGDRRLSALLDRLTRGRRYLRRLPVRSEGRLLIVRLDDVDWMSAADNYVTLHSGEREFLVRATLARLEGELDPEVFVRIHRGTIVRVDRVRELIPESHGDFTARLVDGTTLTVSRTHRERLIELFHL
jgi:two-component system LytT family response regulator